MSSRLYGPNVDEKNWKITEIDNKNYRTYKLVNRKTKQAYFFKNVIGVEQVSEDEFLVFSRYNMEWLRLIRYKTMNLELIKLFETKFDLFDFITDDRILFSHWDNRTKYRCLGIYSIKNNSYVEEAKWLTGTPVEVFNYEDDPKKIGLYVEKELFSFKLDDPKLLFTVDPNTLSPSSDCYSELRDTFIKVTSKEDIENLMEEERKYIRVIEDYMFDQEDKLLKKVKNRFSMNKK